MKIAWFCIPAHGHTNPTLGLVKTLTEAGHKVWYFSFEEFREKIEKAGATFIGCDGYDNRIGTIKEIVELNGVPLLDAKEMAEEHYDYGT